MILCETHSPPNLIKMDVEGAESHVLRGADRVFQTFRPHLFAEVHDDANAISVRDWLEARRYGHCWIEEGPFPKHLAAWPQESAMHI